jgi:predicted amino acid-binding ACT domain protein
LRAPPAVGEALQVLRAGLEDLVGNLVRHPRTLLELGLLARDADLTAELVALAKRDMPVLVLWGDNDRVLPADSFDALCRAMGTEGRVVAGNHSWVLADPDAFGEVMSNVVEVAARAETSELSLALAGTSIPPDIVASLLERAAPLWLMSEPPSVLAGDLALCYPLLRPGEVRAVARETDTPGSYRLTVVAEDRRGLLADTTALLAAEGLSVSHASATTWTAERLAMHSLVVDAPHDFPWDALSKRLRTVGEGSGPGFLFEPGGRALVRSTPQAMGRSLLSVTAPDQIGLLWAICAWLSEHDLTIDAMRVESTAMTAHDAFIVKGSFDPSELAERLSASHMTFVGHLVTSPVGVARRILRLATDALRPEYATQVRGIADAAHRGARVDTPEVAAIDGVGRPGEERRGRDEHRGEQSSG